MYPQASPLIHDSRKWTYKYEGGSKEPSLPGTSDDHSFSDSIFDSIRHRLCPHSSALMVEKTLAPLLEKEDPQDDGGEMVYAHNQWQYSHDHLNERLNKLPSFVIS